MNQQNLSSDDLCRLLDKVFRVRDKDRGLVVLIDLPDAEFADDENWKARRQLAADWVTKLADGVASGLPARLYGYRNVRRNNADLPGTAWLLDPAALPADADALDSSDERPLGEVFDEHNIVLAPTRFSATAPLKLLAPRHGLRAATMPGFTPEMIPVLKLDWNEVDQRVRRLKTVLDRADGANFLFEAAGRNMALHLDLRFRTSHASGALLHEPGMAGNLPSGETYIVPYEGEKLGEPSRTAGELPVELDGEVVVYRIEENRAVGVREGGPVAAREAELLRQEPAYGNIAELGLGILKDLDPSLEPIGQILLDEKLGPHIAFGRSDHFGGQIGAADFSRPEAVVHIDRVYLPESQPQVMLRRMDLLVGRSPVRLIDDGVYVPSV